DGIRDRNGTGVQTCALPIYEELAVGRDEGDAGRVVAAIFEARQPLEQDGGRVARANVPDDATHGPVQILWRRPSLVAGSRGPTKIGRASCRERRGSARVCGT